MNKIIPCVLITLALMFAGFFVPVLGLIGLLLCPLPLSVLGCIESQRQMAIAELMIEITLFLALSTSALMYFLVCVAPVSAIIFAVSREDIKRVKKLSGPESLLLCSGTSLIFKLIFIAGFHYFTGKNFFFPDAAQMALIANQLYGDNRELRDTVIQMFALIPYLMPMMLTVFSGFETFLSYVLCMKFVKRVAPGALNFPPPLPELKTWRFPTSLLFVLVCSFIASYFIKTDVWFYGAVYLMNLQLVINVFMFVQGVAIAFWIMDGFKLKIFAKILICALMMLPFFWAWLIIMGMSDMALNLRERIKFKSR